MLKNKPVLITAGVVVAVVVIAAVSGLMTTSDSTIIPMSDDPATRAAQRGPLTISVVETGTIQAREKVIIKNEVEGSAAILWLIDEGERVEEGDLLIELDSSGLINSQRNQEMAVENADAALVQARENKEVVKNQTESDISVAELNLTFARQDLEKYTEGEYPNQLKAAESSIALAREELLRSEEKLEWSKRLYGENYLSQTELQQDELAANRDRLDLEQAENDLNLLVNYRHRRNIDQLESNIEQAEMALERAKRRASALVIGAEATLIAAEARHNVLRDKLSRLDEQIEKTKIYAPSDGQVVYATSGGGKFRHGRSEPLSEGQSVKERQELIHLPTTDLVKAEISIHESDLEEVEIGMPARVTIDAMPGQTFTGHLAVVAPLPDPQSMWMNPDLRVYNASVYLDNDNVTLRTGMSCEAEIIIEEHNDVVFVPVESVIQVEGDPTVFVAKGTGMEPRKVAIGLDNGTLVHVTGGLEPGEHVLLAPPLASGEIATAAAQVPSQARPENRQVSEKGTGS